MIDSIKVGIKGEGADKHNLTLICDHRSDRMQPLSFVPGYPQEGSHLPGYPGSILHLAEHTRDALEDLRLHWHRWHTLAV